MKLSSLLNPKLIKCGLAAKAKEEALDEMVQLMAAGSPEVGVAELKTSLAEREKLGPFSMAKGSAFPHARTEKISDFRIALGTAPQGLDFKSPDGNLIRLVVLFVIPKKHSNLYLTTLAQFLNLFAWEENLLKATQTTSGEDLMATIDSLSARPAIVPLKTGLASVTPTTTLSKAVEIFTATHAESLPVVDVEGNLLGELSAAALLQLGLRERFLHLSSSATLRGAGSIESVLRNHADATIDSLGVLSLNGYRTVQEDEPLIEMAVKLCQAGARGAYVLRGRRLVGSVTTGEILKKIAGGK
jgi:mannitol/fructose-specific phosphotransferase system IIA component (Ntr-type)/CBS domain-containing protein